MTKEIREYTTQNSQPKTQNPMNSTFKIKSYGRSELASLFMPDIWPKSAWQTFKNEWMERNPRLRAILKEMGNRRRFTPKEVEVIISELGDP